MKFYQYLLFLFAFMFCVGISGQKEIEVFKYKGNCKDGDVKKMKFALYSDSTYLISGYYCLSHFGKVKNPNKYFEGEGTFSIDQGKYVWKQYGEEVGGIEYNIDFIKWGDIILKRK